MIKVLKKYETLFKWLLFISFLIITFILVVNHEIWRDEGQAWLLARDLSIPELFNQMKYEAHSCLWHLVLMPFAKLGFPVITMNLISWLLVSSSIYIVIFHLKFNFITKILIVLNPTFIYSLSIISRCYSLIPLGLALWALLYHKRQEHPYLYMLLLGILANSHMVICGLVGIIALIYFIENVSLWVRGSLEQKKKFVISVVIFLLLIGILAIQVIPSLENCIFYQDYKGNLADNYKFILEQFGYYCFPNSLYKYSVSLCIISFIIISLLMIIKNFKIGIMLIVSFLFIFFIHVYSWPFVIAERVALLFVILVFLSAVINKKVLLQIVICILSILSLNRNLDVIKDDYYNDYSFSKKAATFLNETLKENDLIIFFNSDIHQALPPYITKDVDFYNIKINKFQAYITWSIDNYSILEYNKVNSQIEEFKKTYDNIYLVMAIDYAVNIGSDEQIILDKYLSDNKISLVYENELIGNEHEFFIIYQVIY